MLSASFAGAAEKYSIKPVVAFPNLKFSNPLYIASPPDGSDRLFVVEQDGRVFSFENRTEVAKAILAVDLGSKVRRAHMEEGLLGFAFHPKFRENGFVFLQYSASDPRRNVISRYTMNPKHITIDPRSERVVMEIEQPYGNHNGGMLEFGPDGFLYIGLGDGGSGGDPHDNAQNKDSLLGKMLRIDVDRAESGRAYAIPKDNPFVNDPQARPEIWALGLRNPWRYSFDPVTGFLWAGDVGQDAWEEIDIIKKGRNYGWSRWEGKHPYDRKRPQIPPYEEPLVEHGRDVAQSITGGYVYRGKKVQGISGRYIYGDFMTGNIWALPADNAGGKPLLVAKGNLISSFGLDKDGELYFTSYDGRIYALRNSN